MNKMLKVMNFNSVDSARMKKMLKVMNFNSVDLARSYVEANYDFHPIRIF